MSSDGRYLYNNPPTMATSYDYPPYPTSSYDPTQMPPQPPARQMRSGSSQPHSPHQPPTFNSPPAQYPPAPYGAYGMPPSAGPWPAENWSHYNQSFGPPPIPDASFTSGPGRPEPVPNAPQDQRHYSPSQPNPDPRRNEERYAPPPDAASQKPRRRDKDVPNSKSPVPVSGLDFAKLLESYQLVLDTGHALTSPAIPPQGRPPPAESLERMLQSATYGVQMLENAIIQAKASEAHPTTGQVETEDAPESSTAASSTKKSKATADEDSVQEGQTCLGCNATATPEWRRGPLGPRTLCNACGLVYAKLIKKRAREARAKTSKGPNAVGEDSGVASSDSEDVQSLGGSHGRRSELEDQGKK